MRFFKSARPLAALVLATWQAEHCPDKLTVDRFDGLTAGRINRGLKHFPSVPCFGHLAGAGDGRILEWSFLQARLLAAHCNFVFM